MAGRNAGGRKAGGKYAGLLIRNHYKLRCEFSVTNWCEIVTVTVRSGSKLGRQLAVIVRNRESNALKTWESATISCPDRPFQTRGEAWLMKTALELACELAAAMDAGAVRDKFYKGDEA